MAFNSEQISYAGKLAMDFQVRQKPQDIYNTERPLLKMLRAGQKTFPGAKQYIVEKLRFTNDSNFQWFAPDGEVTYNRKRTITEASFTWGSAHDGFGLTEEELLQNYITMIDDRNAKPTADEQSQFVNLMTENTESLMNGFGEKLDYALHLDGTQDTNAVAGQDYLIDPTPTVGTVGGIDQATNALWRNFASLDIASTTGLVTTEMEKGWRACMIRSGGVPNKILAGSKFIDAYRVDCKAGIVREIEVAKGGTTLDTKTNLAFNGLEIEWDPVLDIIEADGSGTPDYDKRCYFYNTKSLLLRPAEGQDMVTRRPPRVYNRYTHYFGMTWRGAFTSRNRSANAIFSVA